MTNRLNGITKPLAMARLESDYNLDLGDQLDSPAMRKIQKHVRAYKRTM